ILLCLPIFNSSALFQSFLVKPSPYRNRDRELVADAFFLKSVTSDDASVACVWCGALAYFSDRSAIDMLGKSGKKIAREPMHVPAGSVKSNCFYPGHLKWDYAYSIEQLHPDNVAQLWKEPAEAARSLKNDYLYVNVAGQRFFARKDSSKIRWQLIHSLG